MLFDSTGPSDGSAVKIIQVRWVPEVLVVKQVGHKNIRVIKKRSEKPAAATSTQTAIMGLRPQCDEVNIDVCRAECPPLAQHVINGVGASVKRLTIVCELEGVSNVSKIL